MKKANFVSTNRIKFQLKFKLNIDFTCGKFNVKIDF